MKGVSKQLITVFILVALLVILVSFKEGLPTGKQTAPLGHYEEEWFLPTCDTDAMLDLMNEWTSFYDTAINPCGLLEGETIQGVTLTMPAYCYRGSFYQEALQECQLFYRKVT